MIRYNLCVVFRSQRYLTNLLFRTYAVAKILQNSEHQFIHTKLFKSFSNLYWYNSAIIRFAVLNSFKIFQKRLHDYWKCIRDKYRYKPMKSYSRFWIITVSKLMSWIWNTQQFRGDCITKKHQIDSCSIRSLTNVRCCYLRHFSMLQIFFHQ